MNFTINHLYHIYNRGNNSDKVFYKHENYLYFLEKIKTYILPYTDILAWCLMPNHFHLMVRVNCIELPVITQSDILGHNILVSTGNVKSFSNYDIKSQRNLNQSIGILLRSYTNAIQKQEGRTGSLFQSKTKAICLSNNRIDNINNDFKKIDSEYKFENSENNYAKTCFDYIHQNPVKAGLVKNCEDWGYSSFQEYEKISPNNLVNLSLAKELGLWQWQ